MHTSMYIPFILGIVAVVGSFTYIPILTLACVFFLLVILADSQSDARRASPRKLGPDQFLDDLRIANSFPRMEESSFENMENSIHTRNIPDQHDKKKIDITKKSNINEKSKFLEMFEKLSPEEQQKVAQVALEMGEMIATKGVKEFSSKL